MKTIVAVGAHIGDAELTSGPLLAQAVQDGHRGVIVALTAGERGHPGMLPDEYRQQKLLEAQQFSTKLGVELIVFDDLRDGFLAATDATALRLSQILKSVKPSLVTGHWTGSGHPDHVAAAELTERAVFLSGIDADGAPPLKPVPTFARAENWEDMDSFTANRLVRIGDDAFNAWSDAIRHHAFAAGGFSGFRYIDYYSSLMTVKGCLADCPRACAFMVTNAEQQLLDW